MKLTFFLALLLAGSFGNVNTDTDPVNVHAHKVLDIEGREVDLSSYEGKVLLIVNTASKCGYTPQYEGLQAIYETYADEGFAVLGFPANNFGRQEPGSNEEILEFCQTQYSVKFPMFSKVSVKGDDQHPLFAYLTGEGDSEDMGTINWNFEKFIIDKDGNLVKRFRSRVKPTDETLVNEIKKHLVQ